MANTFLVTRHFATVDWIEEQGFDVDYVITHLNDVNSLQSGDRVIGSLPKDQVAQLGLRSVDYWHFSLARPANTYGNELTIDELKACAPLLERLEVK